MGDTRKTLLSGHQVQVFEGAEKENYDRNWRGYTRGMVRLNPGGTVMPKPFLNYHDRIWNFKAASSDVIIMTYPKCGTSWTQEIVWTLRNNPGLDHPMAGAPVNLRAPFIEFDCLFATDAVPAPGPDHPLVQMFHKQVPGGDLANGIFVQMAEHLAHPRTIKTHLPFSLLPNNLLDTAKVIYVYRNPKDVIVSYLHHCRLMKVQDFTGDMEEFLKEFIDGDLLYGHYDNHLKEAFAKKEHKNLLMVRFEDLKANPLQEYSKINKFLGTERTEEEILKIVDYTSFAEMKKRDTISGGATSPMFNMDIVREDGGFFRKGEAGNWKEKLSPEHIKKIDSWTKEKLGELGSEFRYE